SPSLLNMVAASPNYWTKLQFQYQRRKTLKKVLLRRSEWRSSDGRTSANRPCLTRLWGKRGLWFPPWQVQHAMGWTVSSDGAERVGEGEGVLVGFVDTAGIRRKGKTELKAEKLSVVMARRHLERSDVAILVLDGVAGVTALDAHIGGYAHEAGRSVVIAVNK